MGELYAAEHFCGKPLICWNWLRERDWARVWTKKSDASRTSLAMLQVDNEGILMATQVYESNAQVCNEQTSRKDSVIGFDKGEESGPMKREYAGMLSVVQREVQALSPQTTFVAYVPIWRNRLSREGEYHWYLR